MAKGYALHPANLGVRLVLELSAFASFGYWGWQTGAGAGSLLLAVLAPLAAAVVWGVFAVPGDRSRSGDTVVATPGPLRLLVELAVFFGGAAALYAAGSRRMALVFAAVLVAYHVLAWDRIAWLLGAGPRTTGSPEETASGSS